MSQDMAAEGWTELFASVPEAVDVKGAASILGVSVDTVRREIARGNLRRFKVGATVRITRAALIDYVREREVL